MKFDFGIGVDIENTKRFKKLKKNSRLFNRIFTQSELAYCFAKKDSAQHLAVRWAAKEAVIKSMSSLRNFKFNPLDYKNIEIFNDKEGIPKVRLAGQRFKNLIVKISLSHSNNIAIAFAILINKAK